MGKCVDQVYFVEKWSTRQELKFSISKQCSNIIFSLESTMIKSKLVAYCYWYANILR